MYNEKLAKIQKNYLVELGQRLRTIRTNCSITRKEIAEEIGVSVATIQKVEQGKQNNIYIIHKFGIYLYHHTLAGMFDIFKELLYLRLE